MGMSWAHTTWAAAATKMLVKYLQTALLRTVLGKHCMKPNKKPEGL
jgi:hypothetical protein